jgi:hypothetical protein
MGTSGMEESGEFFKADYQLAQMENTGHQRLEPTSSMTSSLITY